MNKGVCLPFAEKSPAFFELRNRIGAFEKAVRYRAASMNNAFWNPLVVKMLNLLPIVEIFEKRWPAYSSFERVLIIAHHEPLIARHRHARHRRVGLEIESFPVTSPPSVLGGLLGAVAFRLIDLP